MRSRSIDTNVTTRTNVRPSFNNDNGGTFILIEPGQIMNILIREPFFIGARPVTQVEWSSVMGNNPSKFQEGWSAGLRPVESVSWFDCQMYIDRLNELETTQRLGLSGIWRLPTAEEWEYACRAGTETRWYHSDRDNLDEVAWHAGIPEQLPGKSVRKKQMIGVCSTWQCCRMDRYRRRFGSNQRWIMVDGIRINNLFCKRLLFYG